MHGLQGAFLAVQGLPELMVLGLQGPNEEQPPVLTAIGSAIVAPSSAFVSFRIVSPFNLQYSLVLLGDFARAALKVTCMATKAGLTAFPSCSGDGRSDGETYCCGR